MKEIKRICNCLINALINLINHDGVEHAGYMAFMTLLSFFPFLVFIVALTGFIGESAIGSDFIKLFLQSFPHDLINSLKPRIEEIISTPPQSLLTFAIIGAIWTASSAVEGLRTILNRIYLTNTPPPYILRRMLSVIQFIILTLLILLSILILVWIPQIYKSLHLIYTPLGIKMHDIETFSNDFLNQGRYIILLIILFLIVCSIYYIIPNTSLKFKSVVPGSIIVVLAWHISGKLLTYYFNQFHQLSLIYGSLASIIASLLFFFFTNMIFIYGAEFNYLYSKKYH